MRSIVLNLDERTDRWRESVAQSNLLPFPIERFSAVRSKSVETAGSMLVTPQVWACAESHRQIYDRLAQSGDPYWLILEDDFVVHSQPLLAKAVEIFESSSLDFLQVGYLKLGPTYRLSTAVMTLRSRTYRCVHSLSRSGVQSLDSISKRRFVVEHASAPRGVVLDDVRAGSHAYLVKSSMANVLMNLNTPCFVAADGFLMTVASMRAFRMGRLVGSAIGQSSSQPSIESRFTRGVVMDSDH